MEQKYVAADCVTAGELRGRGIVVPDQVPDDAWADRKRIQIEVIGSAPYPGMTRVDVKIPFVTVADHIELQLTV